jgi:hypothetical protein
MSNDNGFDANGNWRGPGPSNVYRWSVENQLISQGYVDGSGDPLVYTYDPWGQRVLQYAQAQNFMSSTTCVLYFYSITGQRLGTYGCDYTPFESQPTFAAYTQISINQFFGNRELVAMDRLGSVRYNQNGSMAFFRGARNGLRRRTAPKNSARTSAMPTASITLASAITTRTWAVF